MLRWAGIGLLLCGLASGQQDLVPGLVGSYRDSRHSVQLVVSSPNFYLEAGESLHPSLAADFESEWTGWISILRAGVYSFRGADVTVAGRAVGEPGEILDPGRQPIRIGYHREAGPAALRLEWKAEHFDWEPVPTDRFFHDPAELDGQAALVEEGRRLAENLGCANCHDPESSSLRARPGPSLLAIGSMCERPIR